jgi:hypothetical protein
MRSQRLRKMEDCNERAREGWISGNCFYSEFLPKNAPWQGRGHRFLI